MSKIEVQRGESIKYYKGENYSSEIFLKIYAYVPPYISTLRGIFEKGFSLDGISFSKITFESNMPFALRFMIDKDIVGMGWI